jgi:hypothetical protein
LASVFERLANIYGHLWTSGINTPAGLAGRMGEWVGAVKGLTNEQIERGINICKYECEYINISKFKKAALGILNPERAYELREKDAIASSAWISTDVWLRKTGTEKDVKRAFIANYDNLCEKLLFGEHHVDL